MKTLNDLIWYEHYRPDNLDDLALLPSARRTFESFIDKGEIPHLLFHGPPGSAKTTISMILINACASASLVLNASSSDRGIATVKTTVKEFARSRIQKKGKVNIIFFDEADGITPEAQMALKNTIERYHKNSRFIFTANHIDMVIEEIRSRCMVFKLEQVCRKPLIGHLQTILKAEDIKHKQKDIVKLVDYFDFDVRTMINNMQAASITGRFKLKDIISVFPKKKIFDYIKEGQITEIRKLTREHSNFTWMYKALFDDFVTNEIDERQGEIALVIAEYMYRERSGVDKEINFSACMLEVMDTLEIEPEF